ncbi:LytTR family DNA-binding domain-containing protein [Clostridium sardiniense]|uniref:Stage 0 sporulation protein A homolog n=3 Tax=Clostridium sardiniense TaxID=29369 RepID=A0ABS7KYK0_CLOSR|nr:LytTR family DNA-binding domain-containing protein [Clostridium sardiniense]MBY0755673.1 LytTR family DNA-binding domain-containing protein [Clostridium sardiniense]
MINIAICDDDYNFLNIFEKQVYNIFKKFQVDINIEKYSDSLSFMQTYKKNFYNIIFLDICMPNINGLQVAERIKNIDNTAELVFVTSFDKCVYRSFKFRPFRFVRKNRINDEIEEVIEDFLDYYKKENSIISFKIKDGFLNLNKDEVLYFDIENRKIRIHTKNEIYYSNNIKFNKFVEVLEEDGFIEVHRGYLVNKKYIKEYRKNIITLYNNETIPVSRYKVSQVEKIFNNVL